MTTRDIYQNIIFKDIFNEIDTVVKNVTIDTRKVKENDCYIGLKGEKNDGNKLFMDAFLKGASIAILDDFEITEEIENYLKENNKSIVVVEDAASSLGALAKYKRSLFYSPVVAVTGSAGKTSTKDMIYSVLNNKYHAHKTVGNQNNHLGLPLTVLSLEENNEVLVLEMGMNHLREIAYLTDIARPDVAVITNVGTAHIGNLGSRENILKAKLEILEGLNPNGTLIINNDNDLLHEWFLENKDKYHIITVGFINESDFLAEDIEELENGSKFKCNHEEYVVPVGGEHFIYNALVAIAVASIFNVGSKEVKAGILNFELSSNRMNIINNEESGIVIIDDSYNANYDSMSYALKYLGSLSGRNIAVLGTMRELGKYSKKLHEDIGVIVADEEIDILITVGDDAKYINDGAIKRGFKKENSFNFDNNSDAIKLINELKAKDDNILVKASNSLNFKEIVSCIK